MNQFVNRRVLLVEDEAIIALDVEMALVAAGFSVMGPFATVQRALRAIAAERPNVAVLDVNLNTELAYPIADALSQSQVPFVWMSGHSIDAMPAVHRDRPVLSKPCATQTLIATLLSIMPDKSEEPN